MKNLLKASASALTILGCISVAAAQTVAPQVQSIGPGDLFQDVVNGAPSAQSMYASAAMLQASFGGSSENTLIGGDTSENLFQRQLGTTAVTGGTGATVVYTADRWANWEAVAGSTANSTLKSTTAATLGPGATTSMLFKLTNSQTGTAQVCTAQEISSQNTLPLAGHTVEVDMNAYAGATFTATGINIYIITGTDTGGDNGTANLAFGLNANSVSSTAWAGQTSQTTGAFAMSVSTMYRPMAVANIPSTATEAAVAICFTPSGTSSGTGGTDGVYLSNIELRKADYLSSWVNATSAYSISTSNNQLQASINGVTQNVVIPSFSRRNPATEAALQYSYFYLIAEPDNANNVVGPAGMSVSTSLCEVVFPMPAPMRAAPTLTITAIGGYNALSATTFKVAYQTTPIVLATGAFASIPTDGVSVGNTAVNVDFKTAASQTQYDTCNLVSTASGAGAFAFNSEL